MSIRIPGLCLALALSTLACGGASSGATATTAASVANVALRDDGDQAIPLSTLTARSKLTVLVFFDSDCPVQKAHDARLRELVETYGPREVAFYAVVSDAGANMTAERSAAKERSLPAVLEDRGAALADALGVEYSTHSVVLDRNANVLYSGGVDSDRTHLSPSRERWLEQAIVAATAGKPVARTKAEPLGCPLRKH
jgi:hypothetical protein